MALFGRKQHGPDFGRAMTFIMSGRDGLDRRDGIDPASLARRKMEQQEEATKTLHIGLFGGQRSAPQFDLGALASGDLGVTDTELAQQSPQRQGLPSLRDAAPLLMRAQQAGIDIKDYISLFEKTDPRVEVDAASGQAYDSRDTGNIGRRFARPTLANDHIIDFSDPDNIGRFIPQVGEGQEIVYDAQGKPRIQNIDGYAKAIGQTEGTKAEARAAATNPYELETVMGPDGRPITASRHDILRSGPIYGQSDGGRAYDVTTSTGRAERENAAEVKASSAANMLPSIDRMEAMLPDVISGPGAAQRLAVARAMASAGNTDARRKAAATEVFQMEGRQIVSQIIGAFGSNPTEGERNYAERMAGADVTVTPQALQDGLRLVRARATRDMAASPSAQGQRQGQGQGRPSREALLAEARRRGLL